MRAGIPVLSDGDEAGVVTSVGVPGAARGRDRADPVGVPGRGSARRGRSPPALMTRGTGPPVTPSAPTFQDFICPSDDATIDGARPAARGGRDRLAPCSALWERTA